MTASPDTAFDNSDDDNPYAPPPPGKLETFWPVFDDEQWQAVQQCRHEIRLLQFRYLWGFFLPYGLFIGIILFLQWAIPNIDVGAHPATVFVFWPGVVYFSLFLLIGAVYSVIAVYKAYRSLRWHPLLAAFLAYLAIHPLFAFCIFCDFGYRIAMAEKERLQALKP